MAKWRNLPMETKTMILQSVGKSAIYASVCREWQAILEPKHFERILLSQGRLSDFARIVQGPRRKLVRHIWLRVQLPTCGCPECAEWESRRECKENNKIFLHTLSDLLATLGQWEKPQGLDGKGLTLELCRYSPKDAVKEIDFAHDPYSESPQELRTLAGTEQGNLFHGWQGGARVMGSPFINKQAGSPPTSDSRISLMAGPMVHVVTTLLIRRQYYRDIHPFLVYIMIRRLPKLENIIYERPDLSSPIGSSLNSIMREVKAKESLKQVAIFQDYNEEEQQVVRAYLSALSALSPAEGMEIMNRKRAKEREIGFNVMNGSRHLEHLSMSFLSEAQEFFHDFWPPNNDISLGWKWEKLVTLALTSDFLDPDQARPKVNDLLQAAGTAAQNMPKLRVMEIWHGKEVSHGCLFRYCTDDTSSTITWQSSWTMKLETRVINSWTKMVRQNTRHENVRVAYESLKMDGTQFPASVLRHLQLKDRILHSVSLRQIELLGAPSP
ncbi:hypothetical protein Hte_009875 [Hypoxylon texense]